MNQRAVHRDSERRRLSKSSRAAVVVAAALVAAFACVGASAVGRSSEKPRTRTIVDSLGRRVTIPRHPRRIVSFNSDLTELLYALGASKRIVAPGYRITRNQAWLSKYAPRLVKLPSPQSPSGINVETLAALKPDLIVSTRFGEVSSDDVLATTSKLKIPIVIISLERLPTYDHDVMLAAKAVDAVARGRTLTKFLDRSRADVVARTRSIPTSKRLRVYQALTDPYHTVGAGIFEADQISAAGGVSVTNGLTGFGVPVSAEQILAWNPDAIVMLWEGSKSAVYNDSKLAAVKAVKNRRVYRQAEQGWGFATPRSIFAITWLAKKLYPARFRDVNLRAVANTFYKTVYGFRYQGPSLAG
jgi:iron complex transport system substrate-binding protein